MRMHAFMTKAKQCPESYADAAANATYLAVFSTDKSVVGGAKQPENAGKTFYLTNGFNTAAGERWDMATRTGIQNAEPAATGGGCWSISDDQGATVTPAPCTYADNQTFWVEAWRAPAASGPFQILKQGLDRLTEPANEGDAIGWAEPAGADDESAFCLYEADSGNVVRSSEARAGDRASTIAGASIPEGPVDLIELPGCMADDITYAPRSMDCLVAKTANTVPSNCSSTTPQSRECVLHLFPAFCGDLPKTAASNFTLTGDDAIEACLRRVSQGPCVANPAGAACLSGLFPGIVFATGPPTPQSSSQRLRRSYWRRPSTSHELLLPLRGRQNARDPLFGDPNESWLPAEDQFWIGFAKSIINSAVDFVTHFDDDLREFQVTLCHGMVAVVDALKDDLAPRVKKGCDTLWRLHTGEAVPHLEYQGDLEKAGGMTGEVVQILAPVADAVGAAKALGAGKYLPNLLRRFAPKAVQGGEVLEAASADGSGKTVRIYKKGPNGEPELFKTTKDEKIALQDIENNGFLNCEKIARGARRKRQGSLAGDLSDLDLSCDFSTFSDNLDEGRVNYDSDPGSDSDSDWEYEPPAVIAAHVKAEGLTADESTLLAGLKSNLDGSRAGELYMPDFADPDLQSFRARIEATNAVAERKKIVRDFAAKYKLTRSEIGALKAWSDLYEIHDNALKSAAAKLPPFKGLVGRTTALDDATMTMLTNFESGIISKGDKGVYEIRDLVTNVQSLILGTSGEPPRKFMASSAGLSGKTWFGGDKFFVIQSESGMYISPGVFDAEELYEVDFLDGVSGRMKLLGYDGLTENGVTVPTVFYFQNLPPV
ncbi:hypothetical protein DHEL01_v203528 [Diaporthe helianthi]|uniref:Uncharacterized protein n=1 Tax=Diaporthe helianthi TaxID=158607 RepID=A0A2P5I6E7_DIAHE|nr:hypothetical protein DHEL01_v203528 [Diaporthe helianthi]